MPKDADGSFLVRDFFAQNGWPLPPLPPAAASAAPTLVTPPGFRALSTETIAEYVAGKCDLAARVGPPESVREWTAREIGDGNINYVYVVEGPTGAVVVKQGLPYVRCVGESWPLSQVRTLAVRYLARTCQGI